MNNITSSNATACWPAMEKSSSSLQCVACVPSLEISTNQMEYIYQSGRQSLYPTEQLLSLYLLSFGALAIFEISSIIPISQNST